MAEFMNHNLKIREIYKVVSKSSSKVLFANIRYKSPEETFFHMTENMLHSWYFSNAAIRTLSRVEKP